MQKIQKACPVVLRRKPFGFDILAFRHPREGTQLVKGTIEPGEEPAQAALRELCEESGISNARIDRFLGLMALAEPRPEEWHVFLCATDVLPDSWTYFAADDGGHLFSFFWYSLDRLPDDDWHPIFAQALRFIRDRVAPAA